MEPRESFGLGRNEDSRPSKGFLFPYFFPSVLCLLRTAFKHLSSALYGALYHSYVLCLKQNTLQLLSTGIYKIGIRCRFPYLKAVRYFALSEVHTNDTKHRIMLHLRIYIQFAISRERREGNKGKGRLWRGGNLHSLLIQKIPASPPESVPLFLTEVDGAPPLQKH